ncbi:25166_t:CDS:10 [Cetraspora pellucida]|uniref:25166_t:CDS:1 n=1 Tax=Cetraspora pellucida TaxID=1433469 RepID=A0A9N9CE23_9GLOM|nr:25166_t:CDS:10 [Cetraspora pellucida]
MIKFTQDIYIQSFIIGLILAAVYFRLSRRNEPPLVHYRTPIIGHTWRFLTDCENLILESRKKYGETFSLYVFGQIMTVVGKESTHEIFKKDQEFCFREGIKMQLPFQHIFSYATSIEKNGRIIREFIIGKLKYLTSRLQKNIDKAMDLYIGECDEPKVIRDPHKTLSQIVSIPVANIIVGDECYEHEDLLETFRTLTNAIFGWNPMSKHRNIIINRIRPVVEKRLYDKKKLGDAWVAPVSYALQYYLDDPELAPDLDPNNVNYNYIAEAIGRLVFVSMGTTSGGATRALYDLIDKKKEYWQVLRQEAQEINKQCNGNELTSDDIAKMVKLDSFVKESLRLSNGIVALPHKCISESYYTFENGYQIPRGRIAILNIIDTNRDVELQGQNPEEFHANRHLERNSPATRLERNFLVFGGGKHACPGRALAVNEIKIFLHKVLLKYDVRTETGEDIPIKKYLGPIPRPIKTSIIFEKRKDYVN